MRFGRNGWLCLSVWGALSACTSGMSAPIDYKDAGPDSGSTQGGTLSEAARGGKGGVTAGASGAAGSMALPCPGETYDPLAIQSEKELRMLLNDAIQAGEFCAEAPLVNRPEYRCQLLFAAYALASSPPPAMGTARRGPPLAPQEGWSPDGWLWRTAETAKDAKSLMLGDAMTHTDGYRAFCNNASHEHFSGVTVARSSDTWAVGFVAAD